MLARREQICIIAIDRRIETNPFRHEDFISDLVCTGL
jgi:hypothetical protein